VTEYDHILRQAGRSFAEGGETPENYLAVAAILFALGIFAVVTRRNAVTILMGVELILNAAAINFVVFTRFGAAAGAIDGQVFTLFIIVLAAAEAVVALALVLAVFQTRATIDLDRMTDMKH